jgi:hypothetical protein
MYKSQTAQMYSPTTLFPMKWYETGARYLLGFIYLFGAIDGALFLFLLSIYTVSRLKGMFSF